MAITFGNFNYVPLTKQTRTLENIKNKITELVKHLMKLSASGYVETTIKNAFKPTETEWMNICKAVKDIQNPKALATTQFGQLNNTRWFKGSAIGIVSLLTLPSFALTKICLVFNDIVKHVCNLLDCTVEDISTKEKLTNKLKSYTPPENSKDWEKDYGLLKLHLMNEVKDRILGIYNDLPPCEKGWKVCRNAMMASEIILYSGELLMEAQKLTASFNDNVADGVDKLQNDIRTFINVANVMQSTKKTIQDISSQYSNSIGTVRQVLDILAQLDTLIEDNKISKSRVASIASVVNKTKTWLKNLEKTGNLDKKTEILI